MTTQVAKLKKTAVAALAASVVAAGLTTITPTSAEAQWRPYGHGFKHRPARGAAIAAGIIGGIAAGALIAGASRPAYAAPPAYYGAPSYYQPAYNYQPAYQPAYNYQPHYGYEYQPTCYFRKVRQVVDYDTVVIRRVRVCQ